MQELPLQLAFTVVRAEPLPDDETALPPDFPHAVRAQAVNMSTMSFRPRIAGFKGASGRCLSNYIMGAGLINK